MAIVICPGRVFAEGVENVEQLRPLRAMGCDSAQGFLLGRPAPVQEQVRTFRNMNPHPMLQSLS